jgi:hypothetical protein
MTWLWKWLADFPSTNGRIFVTIALSVGTAVRYWSSETWKPSYEWLAFLIVMAGLDVAQFGKKRDTFVAMPPSGKDVEDTPSKPSAPKATTAETLSTAPQDADEAGDDPRPPGPLK